MSEGQVVGEQGDEVRALQDEADRLRSDVADAVRALVEVHDAAEAEFRPVAHALRVQGKRVRGLCPRFVSRMVHYAKNGGRFPVK